MLRGQKNSRPQSIWCAADRFKKRPPDRGAGPAGVTATAGCRREDRLNDLLSGEASAVPEREAVSVTGVKPRVQRRRLTVPGCVEL